jgi:hypothetical protein
MGFILSVTYAVQPEKAVVTEIAEVSEEKQEDTTNDLIFFG